MNIANSVVFLSGANSGIGRAFVEPMLGARFSKAIGATSLAACISSSKQFLYFWTGRLCSSYDILLT